MTFYPYTLDPRVVLGIVTMSLEPWEGPAKVLLATFIHIGEFTGTRSFAHHQVKGLRITLEPIEMLRGAPQRFFSNGPALLQRIDWAVLDDPSAQQRRDSRAH